MGANATPHPRHETSLPPESRAAGLGGPAETRASSPQGLVAIPVSIFYSAPQQKHFDHYIRFCFMKVKGGLRGWGRGGGFPTLLPKAPGGLGGVGPVCVGAG